MTYRLLIACILVVAAAAEVAACSVCFGDPNSSMVKGAEAGILVLLGVIGSVLFSIIGLILFWARRARRLAETTNAVAFPGGRLTPGRVR